MRRTSAFLLIMLPFLWAVGGYFAGPLLARPHFTVKLAERIAMEDSRQLADRTLESEAFRATGRPAAELFAEAERVVSTFRVGAAVLGAWCGLVLALKLLFVRKAPREDTYEIDHATCVSCARCFVDCPRERVRLREDVS